MADSDARRTERTMHRIMEVSFNAVLLAGASALVGGITKDIVAATVTVVVVAALLTTRRRRDAAETADPPPHPPREGRPAPLDRSRSARRDDPHARPR